MKLEVVTDASGLPLGTAADAANVSETDLLGCCLEILHGVVEPRLPLPTGEATCDIGLTLVVRHRQGTE